MNKFTFNRQDKPLLIMPIGIPGCGKSTIVHNIEIINGENTTTPKIHSSDALRMELYGSEDVQDKNSELFSELHRRMRNDLSNGYDVVYDATNLNKKQRKHFMDTLKRIDCHKVALCIMVPYDVCLDRNLNRERVVPDNAMKSMYMRWIPPYYGEGFDEINLVFNGEDYDWTKHKGSIKTMIERLKNLDQENKHHELTVGDHCTYAAAYIDEHYAGDKRLRAAALLHDIGKEFTKTYINANGKYDGQCHYYQHQNVGAYDSIFYMHESGHFSDEDMIYISNLIYYHMHPTQAWKQSEKAQRNALEIMGQEMYDDVMKVHEADSAAHTPKRDKERENITKEELEAIEIGR